MVDEHMIVLGIESSCDETAAALVTEDKKILSNVVASQYQEHKPFGGVVPEIAARAHLTHIDFVLEQAFEEAGVTLEQVDGIAAVGGPGLIGGVIVGVMMAKGLSMAKNIPFIPVNHLEAHALTARLTDDVPFPFLLLLVSGGHCQFLIVKDVGEYTHLGGTKDDAIGECLDKTARLLGYGYPGGPLIERLALKGNPKAFVLPHPLKGQKGCDFSFSGLKTAARKVILENTSSQEPSLRDLHKQGEAIQKNPSLGTDSRLLCRDFVPSRNDEKDMKAFQVDFCASLQKTIGDILEDRCQNALSLALEKEPIITTLVVAGGVAANQYFKARLEECVRENGVRLVAPPINLCTDNGAMVAWAGVERLKKGLTGSLDFAPRPRWPLDELSYRD